MAGLSSLAAEVAGFGIIRAGSEAIAALRSRPGPPGVLPSRFRPALLKHSDEQTVASLAAVLTAIERFQLGGQDFASWGVVSAPRWLGRPRAVAALNRFHNEGVFGISPMLIPHLSLHAVSGTVSQGLRLHGPNFGVGNGPHHLAEGLLAALALLSEGNLPGLWLTLSQWDPEPAPDVQGNVPSDCVCYAVALALTPPETGRAASEARAVPSLALRTCVRGVPSLANVPGLADFLDGSASGSWLCSLAWGDCVELTRMPGPSGAASKTFAATDAPEEARA